MDLPLDIKFKIASFDINVWILLSFLDDEFKQFSYGEGRKLFIDLFTIVKIKDNNMKYEIFDKIHRCDDKPAIIKSDGTQMWWQNNKIHRDNDEPAIIKASGAKEWWLNGKLHRDNKPAVTIHQELKNGYLLKTWNI